MADKKIPWPKIKAEYLAGGKSALAISKQYNINYDTVRRHITDNGWAKDRKAIAKKTTQKTLTHIIQQNAKLVTKHIERDAQRYAEAEDAFFDMMFNIDKKGKILGPKTFKIDVVDKKTGKTTKIDKDVTLSECRDGMIAAGKANEQKYKALGYEKGLHNLEWESQRKDFEKNISGIESFEEMIPIMRDMVKYTRDPEKAIYGVVDLIYKKDLLQYTKNRALSQDQWDKLNALLAEHIGNVLGNDTDKLEDFAKGWRRILDKIFLEEK